MSQEDLAKAANVDVKTVRDFELGKRWPWSKTRSAIARALRVPALDLQGAGEPEPATPAVPRREQLTPLDKFERAVAASARLTDAEKDAAILDHREQIARQLEELGITETPGFIRRAVRGAVDGDDADGSQRDARPA